MIGALIRSNFRVDPWGLEENEFIRLAQEALFVEQYREARLRNLNAKLISDMIVAINVRG